jgi:hypothetical protein
LPEREGKAVGTGWNLTLYIRRRRKAFDIFVVLKVPFQFHVLVEVHLDIFGEFSIRTTGIMRATEDTSRAEMKW